MLVGRGCFSAIELTKTMLPISVGNHWPAPMFWTVLVCLQGFHVERKAAGCEQGAATGVWLKCGVGASERSDFSTCPLIL